MTLSIVIPELGTRKLLYSYMIARASGYNLNSVSSEVPSVIGYGVHNVGTWFYLIYLDDLISPQVFFILKFMKIRDSVL